MEYRSMQSELLKEMTMRRDAIKWTLYEAPRRVLVEHLIRRFGTKIDLERAFHVEQNDFYALDRCANLLKVAKTIIFNAEQAEVLDRAGREYVDGLEYRLPFEAVFLQFSRPVGTKVYKWENDVFVDDKLCGFLVAQVEVHREEYEEWKKIRLGPQTHLMQLTFKENQDVVIVNDACPVYADFETTRMVWQSDDFWEFSSKVVDPIHGSSERLNQQWNLQKSLLVSCVGFMNLDSVEMVQHEVDEKINRKRVKKGKRTIDPFYTIQFKHRPGQRTVGTGEGSHHSYRYSVAGHFRRLESGRVVWVRPHERGLANEVYIPRVRVAG